MSDEANRAGNGRSINRRRILLGGTTLAAVSALSAGAPVRMAQAQQPVPAQPAGRLPNVLAIIADDIGWFNVSAYHRGMMGGATPNIDRIAREGVLLTDAYGQASCTAGRAAFITGQIPMRTGLTAVGLPGAPQGLSFEDPTLADLLKPLGYMTAQIGKNHLGDRNEFLPTVHGFDEFYGNLYHLNAGKSRNRRTTRRTTRYLSRSSDRAAFWSARPRRRTIRPWTSASAASENKPSGTVAP
jgi:arylsulfatase A-like enzyme